MSIFSPPFKSAFQLVTHRFQALLEYPKKPTKNIKYKINKNHSNNHTSYIEKMFIIFHSTYNSFNKGFNHALAPLGKIYIKINIIKIPDNKAFSTELNGDSGVPVAKPLNGLSPSLS